MSKDIDGRKVDDAISAIEGGWEFSTEVAKSFDTHVRKSIPLYEEFQRMTVDMSEWFLKDGGTVYDIGSSTGETISRLQKKHTSKKGVRFIGIDSSEMMVKEARKKISGNNAEFLFQDVLNTKFDEADLVISLFTLQFLNLSERLQVMKDVYRCLHVGGAFIMAEKVISDEGRFDELWLELYWDFKRRQGLTDEQILHKARSIRGVLRPATLSENIRMLRMTGFDSVDVFLKWYNFAGILAIKSSFPATPLNASDTTTAPGDKGSEDGKVASGDR